MNETASPVPIFAPLWRGKWLILLVGLLVAAGAYLYYKRQAPVYRVSTELYLGAGSEEASLLNGAGTKTLTISSGNQTTLINSTVIEAVHKKLRKEHRLLATHGTVHAKAAEKSQFITITAEARAPKTAALLANLTAQTYIAREHAGYLRGVEKALAIARRQLRRVQETEGIAAHAATGKGGRGAGTASTSLILQAASLSSKVNQLETELSIKGVQQLTPAKPTDAQLLSPKPKQNAIFGLMIGLLLGAVAAYGLSRLNPRLRSLEEVEEVFQTQILAPLPTVKRAIVDRAGRPGPAAPLLEPLRRLHTTLQLGSSFEQDGLIHARAIAFVSAEAQDGRSTLIANLARVQCDAGERVVVIDADFRNPSQGRLLNVADAGPGLAGVLGGALAAPDAIRRVDPVGGRPVGVIAPGAPGAAVATEVQAPAGSLLSVLLSGGEAANPPALLAGPRMAELVSSLTRELDYVLIDAPSPLVVSDVLPLLNVVDGIVIVTRLGHTRQASARRLQELLLHSSSAPILGTVANSVSRTDIEKYGFSLASDRPGGRKPIWR